MPQIEASGARKVDAILQRCTSEIVERWLMSVRENKELNQLLLVDNELAGYLPKLIEDLIVRLREANVPSGERNHCVCFTAVAHGKMRKAQGYTAGMLVHESRIFEVTLFGTLQSNLSAIDFSLLLPAVMTIADEVDSQLAQAMDGYMNDTLKVAPLGQPPPSTAWSHEWADYLTVIRGLCRLRRHLESS
jgi:hypothetical protein